MAPQRTIACVVVATILVALQTTTTVNSQDYYYTRTRDNPNHLRISEDLKNSYMNEIKLESYVNGTKWQYYKAAHQVASHDELVFETIDKMFRHRLSAFYIHNYEREDDKRRSSDPNRVSSDRCARDLLYLTDKLHASSASLTYDQTDETNNKQEQSLDDNEYLTPELSAFFDSYARPEAGVLLGNTYWVGAYEQCVNRHIFDMLDNTFSINDGRKQAHSSGPERRVVSFKGRYCVASLRAPVWEQLIEKRKLKEKDYFKTGQQFGHYSKLFRLQMGICLPDSCESASLERHREEIKMLTRHGLGAGSQRYSNYDLIDLYCLPDETSPLRQWSGSALAFGLVVGAWILLVLLATLADVCGFRDRSGAKSNTLAVQSVGWLSLRANYRKLMHTSEDEHAASAGGAHKTRALSPGDAPKSATGSGQQPQQQHEQAKLKANIDDKQSATSEPEPSLVRVNLRFLNAFKVMIMFWIVNGHIMLLMIQTAKNILDSDALLNGLMHFLIGATFGVDLFFTMTGFITAYLIFNSGHAFKMKPATWLYLSFHRYWRLAPLYLLTFWFSRSVAQLLGSGPLWDYGTSTLTYRGLCNHESWWYPLTLTSNLHGLFEECIITSWYISCDMQFWLVSPVYLHLLAHHPISGWLASLATIAASSRLRFQSIWDDKSARYDELVQPRADIFMRVSHDLPALYTHPHFRISAYIVGLLAGHYVYMIKSGRWSSSLIARATSSVQTSDATQVDAGATQTALSKAERRVARRKSVLAYTGLSLFLLMAFASYLLANYFPNKWLIYARSISAYAYAVDHLLMSVGASLLIVTMCLGQWPRLVALLSHPNWTRLSKINYALLLLQCEAIYFQIFRYEQVPVAGTRELINILFNLLVSLYPLAFAVTLLFEYPLANLEKLLLGSARRDEAENRHKSCT